MWDDTDEKYYIYYNVSSRRVNIRQPKPVGYKQLDIEPFPDVMELPGVFLIRVLADQNRVQFYYNNRKQYEYQFKELKFKNMKAVRAWARVCGQGSIVELVQMTG